MLKSRFGLCYSKFYFITTKIPFSVAKESATDEEYTNIHQMVKTNSCFINLIDIFLIIVFLLNYCEHEKISFNEYLADDNHFFNSIITLILLTLSGFISKKST